MSWRNIQIYLYWAMILGTRNRPGTGQRSPRYTSESCHYAFRLWWRGNTVPAILAQRDRMWGGVRTEDVSADVHPRYMYEQGVSSPALGKRNPEQVYQ